MPSFSKRSWYCTLPPGSTSPQSYHLVTRRLGPGACVRKRYSAWLLFGSWSPASVTSAWLTSSVPAGVLAPMRKVTSIQNSRQLGTAGRFQRTQPVPWAAGGKFAAQVAVSRRLGSSVVLRCPHEGRAGGQGVDQHDARRGHVAVVPARGSTSYTRSRPRDAVGVPLVDRDVAVRLLHPGVVLPDVVVGVGIRSVPGDLDAVVKLRARCDAAVRRAAAAPGSGRSSPAGSRFAR